jgi:probable F420-dependent oxidoreductase
MRIGLNLPAAHPQSSPTLLRDLARRAEDLGLAELMLGEHVVLFDELTDEYQASDDGEPFFPSTAPLPDPLVGLAHLAGVTERIRLGTGVMLLPQRNPVYTAKHVATLDWLSGGRVDLGIGLGWSQQEFAACNVAFEERAARAEEYLEVLRTLWADARSEHHGRFHDLPACRQYPKPVQRPHPPIWIGGWTVPALDRTARLGDGWYGFDMDPEFLAGRLDVLRAACERHGRDWTELTIAIGGYAIQPPDPAALETYGRLGVRLFVFTLLSADPADMDAELRALSARFAGAFEPA